MRYLGLKPGHDGAIALVEDGQLLFSVEGEKDSFHRNCDLTPSLLLTAGGMADQLPDALLPAIQSANRDPHIFPHPDELDLTRPKNPHLTFGYGLHHRLGAPLARMELNVALTGLLRRFPRLRLAVPADGVPWQKGLTVRRPRELPVAW